ncbi:MAG: TolB family protein, partial [Chloroflexota bacterium]
DPIAVATTLGHDYDRIEWSADGSDIMFSEIVPGLGADPCPFSGDNGGYCGSRLFTAKVDGSGSRQVGDPDLDARGPTLSPDGSTVAFGGGEAASEALYLMDWDGSNIKRLETELEGGGWAFAKQSWSADGKQIVTHDGAEPQGVWIVEVDDAGGVVDPERLGTGFWPSYAPDGSAVRSAGERGSLLWTLGDETELSGFPGNEETKWSPDGTQLIGIRAGEFITFDRGGNTIAKLGPPYGDDANWQRVLAVE